MPEKSLGSSFLPEKYVDNIHCYGAGESTDYTEQQGVFHLAFRTFKNMFHHLNSSEYY